MHDEVVEEYAPGFWVDVEDERVRAVRSDEGRPGPWAGAPRPARVAQLAGEELPAGDPATDEAGDQRPHEDPEVHDHHAQCAWEIGQAADRYVRAEAGAGARELGQTRCDRGRDRSGH